MQADSPGVLDLARKLRADRPIGAHGDASQFIFKEGAGSSMEQEGSARALTLALAGRARAVAPILAQRLSLGTARTLIDVGGGTGLYAIACLQRFAGLRAVVWDRPEVLKVAAEHAARHGVADRLACAPGDMFVDPVPPGDVILLSNVLHDWDVAECRRIVARCASALPIGGSLVVHDVLLNDDLGGSLPIALYSAQLFAVTEGRAYSAAEYSGWMRDAGLMPRAPVPTLVHCSAIVGVKG
ncbi:MAG TPA: methyltransferase [Planctomycetota bacterium]|nr:methyltransferase [Planctomycetota bacterium]